MSLSRKTPNNIQKTGCLKHKQFKEKMDCRQQYFQTKH